MARLCGIYHERRQLQNRSLRARIRTFETATRSTLDLSAVPALKAKHIFRLSWIRAMRRKGFLCRAAFLAAIAAGADGLIIEVHPNPRCALSDAASSLHTDAYKALTDDIRAMSVILGRHTRLDSRKGIFSTAECKSSSSTCYRSAWSRRLSARESSEDSDIDLTVFVHESGGGMAKFMTEYTLVSIPASRKSLLAVNWIIWLLKRRPRRLRTKHSDP
jgi:hypothetical protein